jgi:hypothetical protein
LKRALAEKFIEDRDAYALGKNSYIENIIRTASQEYELDESGRSTPNKQKETANPVWVPTSYKRRLSSIAVLARGTTPRYTSRDEATS